jgi:integrase
MTFKAIEMRDPRTGKLKNIGYSVHVIARTPEGREIEHREQSRHWTKRDAERREHAVRQAIATGAYLRKEETAPAPTLDAFAEEFLKDYVVINNRPSAVKAKRQILKRYLLPDLGKLRIDEIKTVHVERLKAKLTTEQDLSPKTVNNITGVLGKLLRWACELEFVEHVPQIKKLRVSKPTFDFLSFEEAERLLKAAKYNPEWYAMIFTALRTGLRFGELSELRWSDVDLPAGRIVVRRSFACGSVGSTKTGEDREIPMSPDLISLLKRHRNRIDGLVFAKPDGGRHIHRRADVGLKLCCKKAGLRLIGWHCLRHSFASHMVMRNQSMKAVQELLGHASMEMTMRYSHLSPQVRRDAVAVLDWPAPVVSESPDQVAAQAAGSPSSQQNSSNRAAK